MRMPARISPTMPGWPRRSKISESSLAEAKTTSMAKGTCVPGGMTSLSERPRAFRAQFASWCVWRTPESEFGADNGRRVRLGRAGLVFEGDLDGFGGGEIDRPFVNVKRGVIGGGLERTGGLRHAAPGDQPHFVCFAGSRRGKSICDQQNTLRCAHED